MIVKTNDAYLMLPANTQYLIEVNGQIYRSFYREEAAALEDATKIKGKLIKITNEMIVEK